MQVEHDYTLIRGMVLSPAFADPTFRASPAPMRLTRSQPPHSGPRSSPAPNPAPLYGIYDMSRLLCATLMIPIHLDALSTEHVSFCAVSHVSVMIAPPYFSLTRPVHDGFALNPHVLCILVEPLVGETGVQAVPLADSVKPNYILC